MPDPGPLFDLQLQNGRRAARLIIGSCAVRIIRLALLIAALFTAAIIGIEAPDTVLDIFRLLR